MPVTMTVGRLRELLQDYPEHHMVDLQVRDSDHAAWYDPTPVTEVLAVTSHDGPAVVIR